MLFLILAFHCIPVSLFPSHTSLLVNSAFHLQPSHDYSGPDDDAVAWPVITEQYSYCLHL